MEEKEAEKISRRRWWQRIDRFTAIFTITITIVALIFTLVANIPTILGITAYSPSPPPTLEPTIEPTKTVVPEPTLPSAPAAGLQQLEDRLGQIEEMILDEPAEVMQVQLLRKDVEHLQADIAQMRSDLTFTTRIMFVLALGLFGAVFSVFRSRDKKESS